MNKRRLKRQSIWPIPPKLEIYDLTLELGNIKHVSIKMKQTGKVSARVLKKWRKRDVTREDRSWCYKECKYLPYIDAQGKFWWRCRKCRCVTDWAWDSEVSDSLAKAYPNNIKRHEDYRGEEEISPVSCNPCLDC